jgi:hypothetical protein
MENKSIKDCDGNEFYLKKKLLIQDISWFPQDYSLSICKLKLFKNRK